MSLVTCTPRVPPGDSMTHFIDRPGRRTDRDVVFSVWRPRDLACFQVAEFGAAFPVQSPPPSDDAGCAAGLAEAIEAASAARDLAAVAVSVVLTHRALMADLGGGLARTLSAH